MVVGLPREKPRSAIPSIASTTARACRIDHSAATARSAKAPSSQTSLKAEDRRPGEAASRRRDGLRCEMRLSQADVARGVVQILRGACALGGRGAARLVPRRPDRPARNESLPYGHGTRAGKPRPKGRVLRAKRSRHTPGCVNHPRALRAVRVKAHKNSSLVDANGEELLICRARQLLLVHRRDVVPSCSERRGYALSQVLVKFDPHATSTNGAEARRAP